MKLTSAVLLFILLSLALCGRTFAQTIVTNAGFGPSTGLISGGSGTYYGANSYGGANGQGTIYSLTNSGTSVSVLYSFSGPEPNPAEAFS